jgi:AmmeMemoRadiSam system protein A
MLHNTDRRVAMENKPLLTEQQGAILIKLARDSLTEKLGLEGSPAAPLDLKAAPADPDLRRPGGIFVSLKLDNRLRGCIGTLSARETLADGAAIYAEHAAFHDPRFPALTASELDRIRIEVSVLTPPQPLSFSDAEDLLTKLRPGCDGVILRKGGSSATFLPQVWEQLPQAEDFLSQLCLKAGLAENAWRAERLSIETYQVQYFSEKP